MNVTLPVAGLPRPARWTVPLSLRLTAAMVLLIGATLLLTSELNFAKFRRTLDGLADSRFAFVLDELVHAIDANIALGVPLNALANVQQLLDQQQARDTAVLSIDVADRHGRLLYSSDHARVGQTLSPDWGVRPDAAARPRLAEPGAVSLARPLTNAFNATVGLVVLRYATAQTLATEQAVLHRLLVQAGIAAGVFSLLALIGFHWLLRGFRDSVRRMTGGVRAVLAGGSPAAFRPANRIEQHFATLLALLSGKHPAEPGGDSRDLLAEDAAAYGRAVVRRMFALTVLVLVLPLGLVGYGATQAFETALAPEMRQKAAALAHAVAADLEHAAHLRVPFDRLVGMPPYLADLLRMVPEAMYVAVADGGGTIAYAAGRDPQAIAAGLHDAAIAAVPGQDWRIADAQDVSDLAIGPVHIGISRDVLARQMRDMAVDVLVLSAAGVLLAFEILLLVVAVGVTHPLALLGRLIGDVARGDVAVRAAATGRSDMAQLLRLIEAGLRRRWQDAPAQSVRAVHAASLAFIRTPLFLFCMAEEFVRSFFPLYAQELAAGVQGLPFGLSAGESVDVLTGLPITVFMLVVAVCTPAAAVWSDRVGRRPAFLLGALIAAAGLLLSAVAVGFWDLLAYRALSGVGYATVFIACQGYLLDNRRPGGRAQSVSAYVGAIAAADLCGPPIGGILADQIGPRLSFVAAAAFALAAWLIAWRLLRDDPNQRIRRARLRLADFARLAANPRLVLLIACNAMPAKLLLSGFLFFLVPVHLAASGQTPYTVGRVMMVYAAGALLVSPLAARVVDRLRLDQPAVLAGGALAAVSLLLAWRDGGLWSVVFAVVGFGVGQAITVSTQLALVTRYAARETAAMGSTTVVSIFRLFERLGAAIGPLVAATLLGQFGAPTAMAALGLASLALLALFALALTLLARLQPERAA